MKRVYVIMKHDNYCHTQDEPFDVVSTMVDADHICEDNETERYIYYWREVISSEE